METFNRLGEEIEKVWRDRNYDESLFPDIAAAALKEANLPSKVSAWDVAEWAMAQTFLPDQRDPQGRFGDPPITIYNSPRFHIDVYFWLEGTTAIHQHAFCGAFQVLLGSSLHSWYEFERNDVINSSAEIGTMDLKLCELLTAGDVQAISAGKSYIHALFHLEQPSATIVVRTYKTPMFLPQFSYYKPYLAIDPFFDEAITNKKMQVVSMMIRAKHPKTDEIIADWLRVSDLQTTFQILSTIRGMLRSNAIDQLFKIEGGRDRFDLLFEVVRERHGERANIFPAVFAHQDKLDEIMKIRSVITNPEHRFFLALLLNVDHRSQILSLVGERFTGVEPLEKVLDWVYELGQTRVVGQDLPNALGVDGFDDLDLAIIEEFINGKSDDETKAGIVEAYGAVRTAGYDERVKRIKSAVILAPLLSKA